LKLQQENEDKKNELIVNDLEKKVKNLKDLLEEKNSKLKAAEANLAEAHIRNKDQVIQISDQIKKLEGLSKELDQVKSTFEDTVTRFKPEAKELNQKVEAEAEKSSKLSEALKTLQETYFGFATRCSWRLREIFNSVGAVSENAKNSTDNIPKALEWVEKEVNDFDEVMRGNGDFCALVAARETAAIFTKAGCSHSKSINKPTFSISLANLNNILGEPRSVGNRFVTQIWTKGVTP
jgi:ABC-type transporter Mla subunit MlaD